MQAVVKPSSKALHDDGGRARAMSSGNQGARFPKPDVGKLDQLFDLVAAPLSQARLDQPQRALRSQDTVAEPMNRIACADPVGFSAQLAQTAVQHGKSRRCIDVMNSLHAPE